jgi:hypothetical protein
MAMGFFASLFEALQVAQIGKGIDEAAAHRVGISGDGAHNADARVFGPRHVVQQKIDQQKVAQMIYSHAHFESVVGPDRVRILGQIHSGVADQMIERPSRLESFKIGYKISDTL